MTRPEDGRAYSQVKQRRGRTIAGDNPPRPRLTRPGSPGEVVRMRVDRGRLNWGVFFIVLGAVPLAYHGGIVSSSALGDAWRLWPFVIVGIGLGFVLSRTPAYFVGGLVVALCLGLVVGSALAIGPNIGCGGNGNSATTVSRTGSFGGSSSVAAGSAVWIGRDHDFQRRPVARRRVQFGRQFGPGQLRARPRCT